MQSPILWVSLLAAAAAIAWGLYASGQASSPATPGNELGLRRFQTPEITEGVRAGERFTMNSDQFTGVDIRASAIGPVRGRFHLELRSLSDGKVVRAADVSASDLVRAEIFQFRFAPIADSRNVRYVFEISGSPGSQAGGVALWATKGGDDVEHVLLFNDRQRFGDLVFQTRLALAAPTSAPVRWQVWLALAMLALSWVILMAIFDQLMVASA